MMWTSLRASLSQCHGDLVKLQQEIKTRSEPAARGISGLPPTWRLASEEAWYRIESHQIYPAHILVDRPTCDVRSGPFSKRYVMAIHSHLMVQFVPFKWTKVQEDPQILTWASGSTSCRRAHRSWPEPQVAPPAEGPTVPEPRQPNQEELEQ